MKLFHNLEIQAARSHFDRESLALLNTIFRTYATPLKAVRRIEHVFRPTP
jgi:hypothetical protein